MPGKGDGTINRKLMHQHVGGSGKDKEPSSFFKKLRHFLMPPTTWEDYLEHDFTHLILFPLSVELISTSRIIDPNSLGCVMDVFFSPSYFN